MESKRQLQVAKIVQVGLSDVFVKDVSHLLNNEMVTVTGVRITPDLRIARVYLSFMLAGRKSETLAVINNEIKEIRYQLGKRIKSRVRVIPDLEFFYDDTLEYAAHMENVFNKLDIPEVEPSEEDLSEKDDDESSLFD